MKCPLCGKMTKVIDSRNGPYNTTRRRRECLNCGNRFTSFEFAASAERALSIFASFKKRVKSLNSGMIK